MPEEAKDNPIDPPGVAAREPEDFEPLYIRGYRSSGGTLDYDHMVISLVEYNHVLTSCQEMLNRGLWARVDVVRPGSLELLGSLRALDDFEMRFLKH